MIEGRGAVAQALVDHPKRLFFARGVSNSQETRESEYEREKTMLLAQRRDLQLVYFGSLSVFYQNTRYTQHKLEMEKIVKAEFPTYAILRLGTLTWGDNPHTIINALKAKVNRGEPIEIQDTTRYVLEKGEFQHWVSLIPDWNVEMNVTGQPMSIRELVKKYVL